MSRIPCEVIKDLLPSYIDELTSDVTNREIEAHIEECEECKSVLEEMKSPAMEATEKEVKELDFLKKTKKKQRRNIVICAAVVWAITVLAFCIRIYFGGQYVNTDYLEYNLDVTGKELTVSVNTITEQGIQYMDIYEMEGIVEITVCCVPKSLFYKETATKNFEASEDIRQVWVGDRIIWANDEAISPLTSRLYAVYNPYVGDMSSNNEIAKTLNMTAYTGNFSNELQTSEEPYAWKIIFENDFSKNKQEELEERLKNYAYIYLAQIGNLGQVEYEYKIDGELTNMTITSDDASAFAGMDIKTVGTDVNLLEELVENLTNTHRFDNL